MFFFKNLLDKLINICYHIHKLFGRERKMRFVFDSIIVVVSIIVIDDNAILRFAE